jgi:hypothetical protein
VSSPSSWTHVLYCERPLQMHRKKKVSLSRRWHLRMDWVQLAGLVVSNPLMISGTGIDVGSARLRHEFACLK